MSFIVYTIQPSYKEVTHNYFFYQNLKSHLEFISDSIIVIKGQGHN